jgi:hypothetical protein
MQTKTLALHPFLFAALIVVAMLWEVKRIVLPEEIIPTLFILQIFTLALLGFFLLCLRDMAKAAIVTSAILAFLFLYRCVDLEVQALFLLGTQHAAPHWLGLAIYMVLSLICIPSLLRGKWHFGKQVLVADHGAMNTALNYIALVLFLVNVIPIVVFEYQEESHWQQFVQEFQRPFEQVKLNSNVVKPDIYYIIVDGFANRDTMRSYFHSDYHALHDFLKAQGFYIVPEAASNYDRTELSLASSLNMQYIDLIPKNLGKKFDGTNVYCRLIQDSAVMRLLKPLGYKYVNISSGTSATDWILIADENFRPTMFNYFTVAVALLTPLYTTERYFPFLRNMVAETRLSPDHCLRQVVNIAGPKFVVFHTDIAHAPPIFGERGEPKPMPLENIMVNWGTPENLAAQWHFAQDKMIHWMRDILNTPGQRPIVIIQSDHGPGIPTATLDDWYNERMRILNAYYFPSKGKDGLYENITPVNSFRVLLNTYFSANLPLLPDKVFSPANYTDIYDWQDVSAKVKFSKTP